MVSSVAALLLLHDGFSGLVLSYGEEEEVKVMIGYVCARIELCIETDWPGWG